MGDDIVKKTKNKQNGAASLFIVVFTALVVVIITVGFVRIMLSDQQQASVNDLSQSAYDSAQAGVEDAKRAILRYENICNTGTYTDCNVAYADTTNSQCNYANGKLSDVATSKDPVTGEVKVQTGASNNLDQAYTCVKILLDTTDFIGDLKQDDSKIIPLLGVTNFDTIKIEWFNSADLQGSTGAVNVPLASSGQPLLAQSSWTSATSLNRPSIMRAQLIQYNPTGFSLSDLDNNTSNVASSSTMFLYPSNINGVPASGFPSVRRQATVSPINSLCNTSLSAGGYACSATIKLPMAVSAGARSAYLNLKALYKKAHYRITLWNGVTSVKFHAVQPEVDSTGRANDLFRRVSSRVELGDISFPFPEAAVDLNGNYCKNFIVTDKTSDYENYCTP